MSYLSTCDYTIILIYFAALIGLGFYLKKKASASLEDYFLGGRNLPWWALGISGMASWVDIAGTMIITSFLFMLGPRGFFIEFRGGVGLVMIVMLLWTGKWHRRSGCITGAEWMIFRFGDGFGGQFARIMTAIAQIIFLIGVLAFTIKAVGLFLSMFIPLSPFLCSLILIGIAAIYTMASGFYGVVFTDMFQALIILIAVVVVAVLAIGSVTNIEGLGDLAFQVTENKDWTRIMPQWHTTMPAGYKEFEALGMFTVFFLLQHLFLGAGMGDGPMFLGARSDRECGLVGFLWTTMMMFRWPLMIGCAILGLKLVYSLFPDQEVLVKAAGLIPQYLGDIKQTQWAEVLAGIVNNPDAYPAELISGLSDLLGENWSQKLSLVGFHGQVNPERILPAVILFKIPEGFRGMILVALIAASMSTFDSNVNMSAGYFVRDIYQRYLRRTASNRELIYSSWGFIAIVVIVGFLFAYTVESINDIWSWIIVGFWGAILVPRFLRFYWWRFNGEGFAIGSAAGLLAAILQRILFPSLDPRLIFLLMIGTGLLFSILGTFFTRPTDSNVLTHFYRTTRPFGLWKPLKEKLLPNERTVMTQEHRNDLISLPFTLCWHVSWLMLPMTLLIMNYKAFVVVLSILLIGLAGMYYFWYRNLPEKNMYDS